MTYLDWAATSVPNELIIKESLEKSLKIYGNPSSQHIFGTSAKDELNNSRIKCGESLNCSPDKLYFTSGATESNNIVLLSFVNKNTSGEIISTSIEHPSVLEPIKILVKFGWKNREINPTDTGEISLSKLEKMINEKTKVISIIYVHNETGVIQPINDIIKIVREKEVLLNKKIFIHIDGVQAIGKIDLDISKMDIDSLSISGHKFGAPKGVGLLYLKNEKDVIIKGGGQERGIRPGTENLFSIDALSNCLENCVNKISSNQEKLTILMDLIIEEVRKFDVSTIPKDRKLSDIRFVPNIVSLTAPPIPGEVLARVLNQKGYMISTGSACSSNKKSDTKGILSMGITKDEGFSSFRVSIGEKTTKEEIISFIQVLKETIAELKP